MVSVNLFICQADCGVHAVIVRLPARSYSPRKDAALPSALLFVISLRKPQLLAFAFQSMKNRRNVDTESSSADWLSNAKLIVAALKSTSTCVPLPYIQPVFEAVTMILDLVERVDKNETDVKYLAESAIHITTLLTDELKSRPDYSDIRLLNLCEEFVRYLDKVASELNKRKSRIWFKKYLKVKSIRDSLDQFTRRLADLRADLTMVAAVGSRFQIIDTNIRVQEVQSGLACITREILSPDTDRSVDLIEEDVAIFKPSELHLDFPTVQLSVMTLKQKPADEHQVMVQTYRANVGHAAVATVRVYEGGAARQMWKRDLEMFAANLRLPGIAQIYGMCKSPRLQALIFHDELVPYRHLRSYH
ncbi:hypothetical protein DFH09DRAFT_124887 [Mycena vulgaris]|nr:hypothetical protein DFH09DRAFT_124887 [Mycena vulgaris]